MFKSFLYTTTAFLIAGSTLPSFAADPKGLMESVIVTASPITDDPDKLATIVGTISRDEILKSGGANLADALSNVPGVTGTSFAGGASRPVIRGFDANRVRILENGIGSFDVSDVGPDHGVPIDPLSAQKIEVVRGAATLRYGSQAIGGVVNTINNRVPLSLPDSLISGEVSGGYGTSAKAGDGSGLLDVRAGDFAIHADGFIRHTGDYDTPLGVQANSHFKGDGFSVGSSLFLGPNDQSRVGAAVVHYDAEYGIPSDSTFIKMHQTKGMAKSLLVLNVGALQSITVDGGYADYRHDEIDPSTNDILSTFIDKEWDARGEALFSTMGPFSGTAFGLQAQHKDFSALGEGRGYLNPTATKSVAGFGFTEVPLVSTLNLQFGVRVERVDVSGTPATNALTGQKFTPVSGSAGLALEASQEVTVGLTLASAARAPGQTELFARGPHDGPGTFETGDPTLNMERANSLEWSLRVHTREAVFEASAWGAKFNNYIYGNITGRTCDDEGVCIAGNTEELKELVYRQSGAKFWGLEGKGTVNLMEIAGGSLGANVLADYVRATLSGGGDVPRMPPYHVGSGLFWDSPEFDASFVLKYAGSQTNVETEETPTKGYASLDAQAAWRPWPSEPEVELAVIGRNLTDRVQRNAVSINKDVVVLPGRDIRVVLRTKF
jgi:iron complex outermembrane recepter protein